MPSVRALRRPEPGSPVPPKPLPSLGTRVRTGAYRVGHPGGPGVSRRFPRCFPAAKNSVAPRIRRHSGCLREHDKKDRAAGARRRVRGSRRERAPARDTGATDRVARPRPIPTSSVRVTRTPTGDGYRVVARGVGRGCCAPVAWGVGWGCCAPVAWGVGWGCCAPVAWGVGWGCCAPVARGVRRECCAPVARGVRRECCAPVARGVRRECCAPVARGVRRECCAPGVRRVGRAAARSTVAVAARSRRSPGVTGRSR
ncbi:hypothetical protein SUDANB51_07315 [Streptomyces sp. enrichment culture]